MTDYDCAMTILECKTKLKMYLLVPLLWPASETLQEKNDKNVNSNVSQKANRFIQTKFAYN